MRTARLHEDSGLYDPTKRVRKLVTHLLKGFHIPRLVPPLVGLAIAVNRDTPRYVIMLDVEENPCH